MKSYSKYLVTGGALLSAFLGYGAPSISVNPSSLPLEVSAGEALEEVTFDLWNSGDSVLVYTMTDDADWITLNDPIGAVYLETDEIGIQVDISGLSVGLHTGRVEIASDQADNSPQTVTVVVDVEEGYRYLSHDIVTSTNLPKLVDGLYYSLTNTVYIHPGAALEIDAGAVFKNAGGRLIVSRGAQLYVNGTRDEPVIFTGTNDNFSTWQPTANEWGNISICGNALISASHFKSAALTNPSGATNSKQPDGLSEAVVEGLSVLETNDVHQYYGGNNDDDDSGSIRYLSIRYAGQDRDNPNWELSGLFLGGVGRETELDYVEVMNGIDDGIEIHGGSANLMHLNIWNVGDDSFDIDRGWRGMAQFGLLVQGYSVTNYIQGSGFGDNIIEMDGADDSDAQPVTAGEIYNFTAIGNPDDGDGATTWRDNARMQFRNSIFMDCGEKVIRFDNIDYEGANGYGYNGTLSWEQTWSSDYSTLPANSAGVSPQALYPVQSEGNLCEFTHSIFYNNANYDEFNNRGQTNASLQNIVEPGLSPIVSIQRAAPVSNLGKEIRPVTNLNPCASADAALAINAKIPPGNGFYQSVSYIGGFSPYYNWLEGWTAADQYGLVDTGMNTNAVLAVSPGRLSAVLTTNSALPSQTFSIMNTGVTGSNLSYTVTDSVAWLSCTPASGVVTGETDSISVDFVLDELQQGSQTGLISVISADAPNSPQTVVVVVDVDVEESYHYVSHDIATSTRLPELAKWNYYSLTNTVYVMPGASLTIDAGAVFKNSGDGQLVVARGGQLFIHGTRNDPVIFTGINDDFSTWRPSANEWGNISICGNALISASGYGGASVVNSSGFANSKQPDGNSDALMEGLYAIGPSGTNLAYYGGNNDDDDSGVIRYLSIRYGGQQSSHPNKELSGLALGGVGRGTEIDYIEVMNGVDDGIDIWGGAVNLKHINVWNVGDDSLDIDRGWRGMAQFGLLVQGYSTTAKQGSGFGDNIIEMDGADDSDAQPVSTGEFYNFTAIGMGSDGDGDGATAWRANARMQFRNSIFMDCGERVVRFDNDDGDGSNGYGYNGTLTWSQTWATAYSTFPANSVGVSPQALYPVQSEGNLCEFTHSIFYNNANYDEFNARGQSNALLQNIIEPGAMPIQAIDRGVSVFNTQGKEVRPVTNLNPCASADAALAVNAKMPPANGFYEAVPYIGAFSPSHNWLEGWSAADQYGLVDTGMNTDAVLDVSLRRLSATAEAGSSPSPETFAVMNGGAPGSSLSYTVSNHVDWLTCVPAGGVLTNESDTLSLVFATEGLPAGSHTGRISVVSVDALDSPQTVTVIVDLEGGYRYLSSDIVTSTNLPKLVDGLYYTLTNTVYVMPGATLTIDAGAIFKNAGGSLAVARDAQLFINGTQDEPVIFTGINDNFTTWQATANEWGGISICGNALISASHYRGSPRYNSLGVQNSKQPDGNSEVRMPGLIARTPNDTSSYYGGNNDDDDSGSIRYLSIRYAGKISGLNSELNGLSLGGVGRETEIDYVEVMNGVDDGIEVMGGTVNLKHLCVWNVGDDSFDIDQGWRGMAQFGLLVQGYSLDARQGSGYGDNLFEMDGAEDSDAQPVTTGEIYNFTAIGMGNGNGEDGDGATAWRDGCRMQFRNSIFMDCSEKVVRPDGDDADGGSGYGYNGTLTLAEVFQTAHTELPPNSVGVNPASLYPVQSEGNLSEFSSCIFYNNNDYTHFNTFGQSNALLGNIIEPGISPIQHIERGALFITAPEGKTASPVTNLNPCATADAAVAANAQTPPDNGFYEAVSYIGAFSPYRNWLEGWTAADQYGLVETGMNTNVVFPNNLSATVPVGSSPASQAFFIINDEGPGTNLNYTVSDDADWLSCTPVSGVVSGEADTVSVLFATEGLLPGTHTGRISVVSSDVPGSPFTVDVVVVVEEVYHYLSGDVVTSTNLPKLVEGNYYSLTNTVHIRAGASLDIDAGAVFKNAGGRLVVSRGAQLFINGTQNEPVIFTGTNDNFSTWQPTANQWGNITICGNALISASRYGGSLVFNSSGVANSSQPDGFSDARMEALYPIGPNGTNDVYYGGGDDDDDSGAIRYLSIRYAGRDSNLPLAELGGLALGGVGRGTEIDYVEVMNGVDDGIDIWGGTVNLRHINVWNAGDDSLDIDRGWRGRAQFGLLVQGYSFLEADPSDPSAYLGRQGSGFGDNIIEMDGADDSDAQPVTTGEIYNFTAIGMGADGDGDGATAWRDNARMQFRNCIFMDCGEKVVRADGDDGDGASGYGYNGTLTWEQTWDTAYWSLPVNSVGVSPQELYPVQSEGNLCEFTHSIFYNNANYDEFTARGQTNAALQNILEPGNMPIVTLQRGASVINVQGMELRPVTNLNPCAAADAAIFTNAKSPPVNGFCHTAPYIGGFSPYYNWLEGWTAADQYGLVDTRMNTNNAPLLPGEIAVIGISGLLSDGGSEHVGNQAVGIDKTLTFTIRNQANGEMSSLSGFSISKDGVDASSFSFGPVGLNSLANGDFTSFRVTYTPQSTGNHMAEVHITSNDPDENPFDITLTGTGLPNSDTDPGSDVWETANGFDPNVDGDVMTQDSDGDGTTDIMEIYQGTDQNGGAGPAPLMAMRSMAMGVNTSGSVADENGLSNVCVSNGTLMVQYRRSTTQTAVAAQGVWVPELTSSNWLYSGESSSGTVVTISDNVISNGTGFEIIESSSEVTSGDTDSLFFTLELLPNE